MHMQISMVVVDSRDIIRLGLREISRVEPSISIVTEAIDITEAAALTMELKPAVLITDISWRDEDVYGIVRSITDQTKTRCMAFTDVSDHLAVGLWLRAGGTGYMLKKSSRMEIVHGIRRVASGQTYVTPLLHGSYTADALQPAKDALSKREQEIALMVAIGNTSLEISEELCISRRTVENHRLRISQKLGAHTRSQLLRYVVEQGIMDGK